MVRVDETVGRLVAERPERSRVFEEFGIDYCCGGKQSVEAACARARVEPTAVLRRLAEVDAFAPKSRENWDTAPLGDLCDHIVTTHHEFLRREMPRTRQLLAKVAKVHGDRHPEMRDVLVIFEHFAEDMTAHMAKEEIILFPRIRAGADNVTPAIRVMEEDHDHAAADLSAMRQLTNGFVPPADGCMTYRVALAALQAIEADTHTHVHKENHILFPRVEGRMSDAPDLSVR